MNTQKQSSALHPPRARIARSAIVAVAIIAVASGCQLPIGTTDRPVTGVSLDRESLELTVGGTAQLVATVSPSNAANKAISWTSSTSSVSVSSSGLVSAVSSGSAVVTVTTLDGSFTDTCAVTVTAPVSVTGVELDAESLSIQLGRTAQLSATVLPSNASNVAVTWSSSSANASVSSSGLVTAGAIGSATITVTTEDGSFTDSCEVTVIPVAVTGVSLNKTSTSLAAGKSETLVATVAPSDAADQEVSWSTSDADIVAVDDGQLLAIAAGTATITVTTAEGGYTATCEVTVTGSLSHTYSEVLPAALALQNGLNAALASNDPTESAYCEFYTSPSWYVVIHLGDYDDEDSTYVLNGAVTADVNSDYSVGAMNGTVSFTGGVVSTITYSDAVFQSPKSGTLGISFVDGASGSYDLATGEFTED